jgi:uncharacterized membrane protein YqgA involved in biofilm formation
MIGLGTMINTAAVLLGGLLGLLLKNGIPKRFESILMQALGLSTAFIGAGGVLKYMLVLENGALTTRGTMLLIFSLVLGCLVGQWLDIEAAMEKLGVKLKAAARIKNDHLFVEGFVTTSLIICVGAMAIVGAMEDGLSGDSSTLVAKAVLDFALVAILASAYGVGAVFSALPIFLYQGAITAVAALFGAVIPEGLIQELSFVGSALITCVGVNLVREKTFRVANMLPALLIPIAWHLISLLT